ncbi:hypothetical protein A2111_02190 [Candidatus Daviesbacteria bacterium GWA1_38_6]|nr:MAG: hypothetical protein A2111_02190 [Candidatus Daviesbacteria bacterium GWA1_38_6]
MIEILPIKVLRDEDANIFGKLNVFLGKLSRLDVPVADGIVVTPPVLHLKTTLEHFDFGDKELFEQSLSLVKKEIEKTPVPEILEKESKGHDNFLVNSEKIKGVRKLWLVLLYCWINQIKDRLWKDGFYIGITENLAPQVVIFTKKPDSFGLIFYEPELDETIIDSKSGQLLPLESRKLDEMVQLANKRLLIPHKYEWILDNGIKLTKVLPYTPGIQENTPDVSTFHLGGGVEDSSRLHLSGEHTRSAVKVFLDLSTGLTVDDANGVFISSEKIFDLNKPQTSFEELIFKLVECGTTFSPSPVLVKLADMSEGMGKIRGTLRLLHQKSLLDPPCEAILFARNKKDLINIHVVIPFVRGVNELMQIKRELAVKKLMRKNSLQQWLEIAVPENIINLDEYLITGIDGVVLNLDELSAHFAGYDHNSQDVSFYKHEVSGLLKFLEDGIKLMHKSKIPFIAQGSLCLNPVVLEFLVEKGVYGIVAERYEAPAAHDLLHQAEKRMILNRSS